MAEKEPSVSINNRQAQEGQLNLWVPLPPGFSAFYKPSTVQNTFISKSAGLSLGGCSVVQDSFIQLTKEIQS